MIGREGPGPERPGPDYPPEWDAEPEDHESAADLAESAARRRAEHEANDGPGPDGHHVVTGECFACLVGVATGPESHGDYCSRARPVVPDPWATQGPVPPPPF